MKTIILGLIILTFTAFAMEGAEADLQQCRGSILEAEPDIRHETLINNKTYFLIDHACQGLTKHDLHMLRQIVPFAIWKTKRENIVRTLGHIIGGSIIGFIVAKFLSWEILGGISRDDSRLLNLGSALLGGIIGTLTALYYGAVHGKAVLETTIKNDIIRGRNYREILNRLRVPRGIDGNLINHSSCLFHSQTPEEQVLHELYVRRARMALGSLFVPQDIWQQLELCDGDNKPLETYLLQPESPLNIMLKIPKAYRGNRKFVANMMNFINDCEVTNEH